MRLRFLRRWRRRQAAAAVSVVGLAVFVLALVVWVGREPSSGDGVRALPTDSPFPTLSESVYPESPSASGSASGTATGSNSGITQLPPLPNLSAGNDVAEEQGRHQVTIRASSDTTILTFRYGIRGGKPPTGEYHGIRAPVTINSPARGNGVLAVVQVQASLYAKGVECAILIDGVLRSHNSAKGPHSVAVCVA
jgi:hypothetical protein